MHEYFMKIYEILSYLFYSLLKLFDLYPRILLKKEFYKFSRNFKSINNDKITSIWCVKTLSHLCFHTSKVNNYIKMLA